MATDDPSKASEWESCWALVGVHPLGQGNLPRGSLLRGIQGRPGPGCFEGACPEGGSFGQEVAPNQGPRGEAHLGPN